MLVLLLWLVSDACTDAMAATSQPAVGGGRNIRNQNHRPICYEVKRPILCILGPHLNVLLITETTITKFYWRELSIYVHAFEIFVHELVKMHHADCHHRRKTM